MVCAWKFRVEVGEEVGPEEYFKMRGMVDMYFIKAVVKK